MNVLTGEEISFEAPLFADCTGDATLGVLAGARYAMGREAKTDYDEDLAPQQADHMTMGVSMQWYAKRKIRPANSPSSNMALALTSKPPKKRLKGEWTWETGLNSWHCR